MSIGLSKNMGKHVRRTNYDAKISTEQNTD